MCKFSLFGYLHKIIDGTQFVCGMPHSCNGHCIDIKLNFKKRSASLTFTEYKVRTHLHPYSSYCSLTS